MLQFSLLPISHTFQSEPYRSETFQSEQFLKKKYFVGDHHLLHIFNGGVILSLNIISPFFITFLTPGINWEQETTVHVLDPYYCSNVAIFEHTFFKTWEAIISKSPTSNDILPGASFYFQPGQSWPIIWEVVLYLQRGQDVPFPTDSICRNNNLAELWSNSKSSTRPDKKNNIPVKRAFKCRYSYKGG